MKKLITALMVMSLLLCFVTASTAKTTYEPTVTINRVFFEDGEGHKITSACTGTEVVPVVRFSASKNKDQYDTLIKLTVRKTPVHENTISLEPTEKGVLRFPSITTKSYDLECFVEAFHRTDGDWVKDSQYTAVLTNDGSCFESSDLSVDEEDDTEPVEIPIEIPYEPPVVIPDVPDEPEDTGPIAPKKPKTVYTDCDVVVNVIQSLTLLDPEGNEYQYAEPGDRVTPAITYTFWSRPGCDNTPVFKLKVQTTPVSYNTITVTDDDCDGYLEFPFISAKRYSMNFFVEGFHYGDSGELIKDSQFSKDLYVFRWFY